MTNKKTKPQAGMTERGDYPNLLGDAVKHYVATMQMTMHPADCAVDDRERERISVDLSLGELRLIVVALGVVRDTFTRKECAAAIKNTGSKYGALTGKLDDLYGQKMNGKGGWNVSEKDSVMYAKWDEPKESK